MSSFESNRLLASLFSADRTALVLRLERMVLPVSTRLYSPEEPPEYGHFMTVGVASIVTSTLDGQGVEVAIVGSEGLVEAAQLLGDDFYSRDRIHTGRG